MTSAPKQGRGPRVSFFFCSELIRLASTLSLQVATESYSQVEIVRRLQRTNAISGHPATGAVYTHSASRFDFEC